MAITFWHPRWKLGAMCHYVVPERPPSETGPPDGKYAVDAIGMIAERFRSRGIPPEAFEVKLFGGGNMFPDLPMGKAQPIGEKNIEVGRRLLKEAGFQVLREDLAGLGNRTVIFDIQSGKVWIRQGSGVSLTEGDPTTAKGRTP